TKWPNSAKTTSATAIQKIVSDGAWIFIAMLAPPRSSYGSRRSWAESRSFSSIRTAAVRRGGRHCSAAVQGVSILHPFPLPRPDTAMAKWVYFFGGGKAEGKAAMGGLLGGKGANLAEMSNLGLPVPPGFTITTEACTHYYAKSRKLPRELKPQVEAALKKVGRLTGKSF